jgi:hypothetical protein
MAPVKKKVKFVDLAAPSPPSAPKEEEEDWEFSGDDGGGRRRCRHRRLQRLQSLVFYLNS